VPGGGARLAPGAAFAPAVTASAGGPPLDQVIAALGRDPGWRSPARPAAAGAAP